MNMAQSDIKEQLEQKLATLQGRLASIKKDVTQAHSGDSAEQAQERENDEVIDAIGNETALSVRLIREALDRMDEGTYGSCERCGEDIAAERLQAIPEAQFCLACADSVG